MPSLKEEVPFESRVAETHKIRAKYPNRIPVVCEKANRSNLPEIEKKKFLVPMNMLVGEFKFILHQHINQSAYGNSMKLFREKTIYLFVNNVIPKTGLLMQELYDMYKDEDGYLYLEYSCESCFG
ncbi:GABA(A) receptor-associated protein (autophagy-like protein 8) [Plasmodium inui San Antonio 1]|uniref:Autophagy-related protein n=1 Tax=Plasmodium inui San Antonio 1 TaxID=1237626 RepID=W6ZZ97_9APIC|nr:GABA(A) receptor-associated protein (autophagy-like protein 8) [Plasmodium inui San Antonio 1]EUD64600.1 GABA(A) receptor-associated protein (autophagy-like protein 8) [Plasmodium inui San Antonio 1]